MASWSEFQDSAPEFAGRVLSRFQGHPHHVLGTLDSRGAPRLSGINVMCDEGTLWFGSMPGALKARDIARDPRVSVHSAPLDEHLTGGDARIDGTAVPLGAALARRWRPESPDGEFFRLDVARVHLVEVREEKLVVTMWNPRDGLRIVERS